MWNKLLKNLVKDVSRYEKFFLRPRQTIDMSKYAENKTVRATIKTRLEKYNLNCKNEFARSIYRHNALNELWYETQSTRLESKIMQNYARNLLTNQASAMVRPSSVSWLNRASNGVLILKKSEVQ